MYLKINKGMNMGMHISGSEKSGHKQSEQCLPMFICYINEFK